LQDSIASSLAVSQSSNANGWNNSASVTLTVTASDGGSGLASGSPSCQEGTTNLPLTASATPGTWTTSVSGEGTHVVDCQATDKASNQTLKTDTVKIDTVNPSISVSHPGANAAGWNKSSPVTVPVTASDGGSGLAGKPRCTDTAREAAPNGTDTTTTETLQDSIAPSLSVSHSSNANGWNNSASVTLTVTASDGGSGLASGSPSCQEGTTNLPLTASATPGTWTTSVSGEGTHVVDCQATDK